MAGEERIVLPKAIDDAIERFDKAANNNGWARDCGEVAYFFKAEAEWRKARNALKQVISAALASAAPSSPAPVVGQPVVPEELRALSEKATPGRWREDSEVDDEAMQHKFITGAKQAHVYGQWPLGKDDRALILAAVNFVRALIANPAPSAGEAGPMWRHKASGTTYAEVGSAYLQASSRRPAEGDTLVLYRGSDGILRAREISEFADGRFERVTSDFAREAWSSLNPVLDWAVERWNKEVKNRPLSNVHRRTLDTTWRQVIKRCGGDPDTLVGPCHDELLATPTPDPESDGEKERRG